MKYTKLIASSTLALIAAVGLMAAPATMAHYELGTDLKANVNVSTDKDKDQIKLSNRTSWNDNLIVNNGINNGMKVSGKASIRLDSSKVLYNTSIRLHMTNFPPRASTAPAIYEAWLVSDSAAANPTGSPLYELSLGAFMANSKNQANLSFYQKMINPKGYNKIIITEQTNLNDPRPGEVIFSADLNSLIF